MSSLVNVVPQKVVLAETAVKGRASIPIDAVVVEGNCEVDAKILTGESFPVAKQKDSTTTGMSEDCVIARIAKIVDEAQNNKSRTPSYEMKYIKLIKTNPTIQRNITAYKAVVVILKLVGFCEGIVTDEMGKVEAYLMLKRNDPDLLWLAKASLEICIS
ncbi:heavy metal atpase 2 [Striga asiatica]|uniref:Heavy metal atpase 2 n=1 Tax=Striga asiatica TaxID=4170 RepID=A0A5A7P288_STRAF|nr:heavy metal atpase 2 [Striga asiatica]